MTRLALVAFGLLLSSLAAGPAAAQPATMLNGVENVAMAPIDVVLAPVVAVRTMRGNIEQARVGAGGQVVGWTLGVPWVYTLQSVLSGARIVSGVGEMLLGLALVPAMPFTDVPERQLFDATTSSPWVNQQGAFDVVFGSHYIATQ